jgi:hypothetical protein
LISSIGAGTSGTTALAGAVSTLPIMVPTPIEATSSGWTAIGAVIPVCSTIGGGRTIAGSVAGLDMEGETNRDGTVAPEELSERCPSLLPPRLSLERLFRPPRDRWPPPRLELLPLGFRREFLVRSRNRTSRADVSYLSTFKTRGGGISIVVEVLSSPIPGYL